MTIADVTPVRIIPNEMLPTYIAQCCREWIMPMTGRPGRCGICGERPTYLRDDV